MEEEIKSLIKVGVSTINNLGILLLLLTTKNQIWCLSISLYYPGLCFVICSSSLLLLCNFLFHYSFFLISYCQFKAHPLFIRSRSSFSTALKSLQIRCFTCFPIQRQKNPKSQNHLSTYVFAVKVAIFVVLLYVHNDVLNLPPALIFCLHPLYVYLLLEILLTLLRMLMTIVLGCDLEPHFHEPFLGTSLQDFWGRRWNLIVSSTLRACVYIPVRRACQSVMSSDYAILIGVFATFVVSGVAHEVVFFYITREMPTGEVALFFVLHGICTVAEVAMKRTAFVRRWPVRPVVSWLLTMGFVNGTAGWLFFPQLIRSNVMEKCSNEIILLIDFFKNK